MSKLQEFINRLCPDGVLFRPLWEVTIWDKRFNGVDRHKQQRTIKIPRLFAKDMQAMEREEGNVILLSSGKYIGYTTEKVAGEYLCEGEIVTIPMGGSAKGMKYHKGKFVTANNHITTSADTSVLNNKFLYYFFLEKTDVIQSFFRGSGIQQPNMNDVLNLSIPIPPLVVQEEIVRILDTFSACLETESTNIKEQYEYNRDSLLTVFKNIEIA